MSKRNLEFFYNKLLQASIITESQSLAKLFEEDFITDMNQINWIFEKAIKNEDIKIIDFLLSSGIKIVELNDYQQTIIHLAFYHDSFHVIDLLFSYCNENVNYTDNNGLSHFHIACVTGNLEIASRLLQNGIDVNHRANLPGDSNNFSPLHFAVKYIQVPLVDWLLKHEADPNGTSFTGETPLHLVCRGVSRRIEKLMKRQNFLYDEDMLEAFVGHDQELDIVRLLLKYGGNVNARDAAENTPLFFIFRDDYLEQINDMFHPFICNGEAKQKNVKEFRKRQKEKIELFLRNGADIKVVNNTGDTILHAAIGDMKMTRRPRVLRDVCFDDSVNIEMLKLLLKHGVDIDKKNNNGETPLQTAVSLLSLDAVELLLNYGADANNVRFHCGDDHCFYYFTDAIPCLEASDNLIKILNIFISEGFHLTQRDNLAILNYLITNSINCQYADSSDENVSYKLKNLLELGTNTNIKNSLDKFPQNPCDISFVEQSTRKQMIRQLFKHLRILENGNLYVNEEVRNCLKQKIFDLEKRLLGFLDSSGNSRQVNLNGFDEEVQRMKLTMLSNNVSLHDILRKSPDETYSRIKSCNYRYMFESDEFVRYFSHSGGIIKGHFAKSLVRRYVVKSSIDYLRSLIPIGLPDLCCRRIFEYLSNENLLNLCLAATADIRN